MGYRYFDSFGVKPLFSFGYGLSYTSFGLAFRVLQTEKSSVQARVAVTNTDKAMPAGKWCRYMYLFLRAELKKRAEDLRDLQRQTV